MRQPVDTRVHARLPPARFALRKGVDAPGRLTAIGATWLLRYRYSMKASVIEPGGHVDAPT